MPDEQPPAADSAASPPPGHQGDDAGVLEPDEIERRLGWSRSRANATVRGYLEAATPTSLVHDLTAEGRAPNQCPTCGTYRLDGQPPVLHKCQACGYEAGLEVHERERCSGCIERARVRRG